MKDFLHLRGTFIKRLSCFVTILSCMLSTASINALWGLDLQAETQLLQKKPDVTLMGDFDINAKPAVVEALLNAPMLVARLWEANGFTPRYAVRMQGTAMHVDDPTGIQGDLYPVEQSGSRRVWIGIGNLNHKLVPSFRGKMALVLTTVPKGSGITAHMNLFIRTESRALGLLASAFFPLVKSRVQNRMTANAADISTILAEVSAEPLKAAGRLGKDDAAALLKLFPQEPPTQAKVSVPKPAASAVNARKAAPANPRKP